MKMIKASFIKTSNLIMRLLGGIYIYDWNTWFLPIFPNNSIFIIDDGYPDDLWKWRTIEFDTYLKENENIIVYCTCNALKMIEKDSNFKLKRNEKAKKLKIKANRIRKMPRFIFGRPKIFYTLFLSNATKISRVTKKFNIPYYFTLYPGGHFGSDSIKNDINFANLDLHNLKNIIINQNITEQIIFKSKFYESISKKTILIPGAPILSKNERIGSNISKHSEDVLIIGFVAHKYTTDGKEKGFETFLKVAERFTKIEGYKFQVIGNFSAETIPRYKHLKNIEYLGALNENEYLEKIQRFHVYISLSLKNKYSDHDFDGFPLSSIYDAIKFSCIVLTTDEMCENEYYDENSHHLILINEDIDCIEKQLIQIKSSSLQFKSEIINKNNYFLLDHFSFESQMATRIQLLNNLKE